VTGLDRAAHRGRDAVGAEDEVDQRGDGVEATVDDRDLLGRHPLLADQARDLGGDQLDLGAFAAALQGHDGSARIHAASALLPSPFERHDGSAGLDARRLGLIQRALDVVQRVARGGRVVVRDRGLGLLGRAERQQLLVQRRACREGRPAGLEGQRQHHLGPDGVGQRVDDVALQRREVVEPVQEDGRRTPAQRVLAQRVERGGDVLRAVVTTGALLHPPVSEHERAELLSEVGARGLAGGPVAQRAVKARRLDARLPQLLDKRDERGREARRLRGAGQALQRRGGDRRGGDALALQVGQRAAGDPAAAGQLAQQALEALDAHAEHGAVGGQLAAVDLDVGQRRHDEQRRGGRTGARGLQDGAGLRRVGGAGDEVQGHGGSDRVAAAPDGMAGVSQRRRPAPPPVGAWPLFAEFGAAATEVVRAEDGPIYEDRSGRTLIIPGVRASRPRWPARGIQVPLSGTSSP